MRLFAGDRIYKIIDRFKLPDDQPMEASILSKQIENAQKKVEEQNFVSRKNVLKYDDVMNTQRMVIYEQRRSVLEGEDLSEDMYAWIDEVVDRIVRQHTESEFAEEWDLDSLYREMETLYETEFTREEMNGLTQEELIEELQEDARDAYGHKEEDIGPDPEEPDKPLLRRVERYLVLQVVDLRWREHLEAMEYMREGIHLRAMAQKDPLVEYRGEGHAMFEELSALIREEVVRYLLRVEIERQDAEELEPASAPNGGLFYEHESVAGADAIQAAGVAEGAVATVPPITESVAAPQRVVSEEERVGRNDPCPCGSGKKYKKCHGS